MKKRSKESTNKLSNMASFTIVIIVMFMTIIGIEIITVTYENKNMEKLLSRDRVTTRVTSAPKKYDTSNLDFTGVSLENTDTNLSRMCESGCNLNIQMYGFNYKFIIKHNNRTNDYTLDIVKSEKAILEDKNLGTDISNLSVVNYSNYIVLKNIITKGEFKYDYALFLDNRDLYDEFSSLNANEMEFTENGIIYYYDVCGTSENGNARKIKAIRVPYSKTPAVISSETTSYAWCN